METPNEPKPKRKYVMTPERHAKLMANLAKARLAPKEKVYRKTPRRYAANVGNLAKANAKLREQSESHQSDLREKLEGLFPAPKIPPPPIIVTPYGPASGAPPVLSPGSRELDEAAALIAKRLRKLQAARRRDGRRIMRLLTEAISRSHPLSAEEACKLVHELLACLDGSRVVAEAHRLNAKIGELLVKMLEVRYAEDPQFAGSPQVTMVQQYCEELRQRAAARREAREARAAEKAQEGNPAAAGSGSGVRGSQKKTQRNHLLRLDRDAGRGVRGPQRKANLNLRPLRESPTPNPEPRNCRRPWRSSSRWWGGPWTWRARMPSTCCRCWREPSGSASIGGSGGSRKRRSGWTGISKKGQPLRPAPLRTSSTAGSISRFS